MWADFLSHF
jgi:hypothetical protein